MTGRPIAKAWTGSKVMLRAWEPEDWVGEARWTRDTEGQQLDGLILFPRSDEAIRKKAEDYARLPQDGGTARLVIATLGSVPIGVVSTDDCDARNGTFSFGLYVDSDHRRNGYATEAVLLLLRYYFSELRYQKANTSVYEFNEASTRLHERLGFALEGRRRHSVYTNGRYHDLLLFGLTAEEYREKHAGWLAEHNYGPEKSR